MANTDFASDPDGSAAQANQETSPVSSPSSDTSIIGSASPTSEAEPMSSPEPFEVRDSGSGRWQFFFEGEWLPITEEFEAMMGLLRLHGHNPESDVSTFTSQWGNIHHNPGISVISQRHPEERPFHVDYKGFFGCSCLDDPYEPVKCAPRGRGVKSLAQVVPLLTYPLTTVEVEMIEGLGEWACPTGGRYGYCGSRYCDFCGLRWLRERLGQALSRLGGHETVIRTEVPRTSRQPFMARFTYSDEGYLSLPAAEGSAIVWTLDPVTDRLAHQQLLANEVAEQLARDVLDSRDSSGRVSWSKSWRPTS